MDLELVHELAEERPDLQLVMIGPVVKIDAATLPRARNIHWLGPKRYGDLPAYIASWDAAIMPFARNEATTFISPTKTLEYLAAGKPVVSTSIHDVVRSYGDDGLVSIADDAKSFAKAVDTLLAMRGSAEEARRQRAWDALLARTSWDRTWARMRSLVEGVEAARASSASARPRDREGDAPWGAQ
jgi:UDP-galactopyranose mutase